MNRKIDIDVLLANANKGDRKKTLGLFDLSILGIGAIIGTGILVLTGIVAATDSGPGVVYSFLIAALASGLIGLCYSELTTSIPNSGSAYVYAWASIGQTVAFFAGWTLLGVYITTTATVANGWSGYVHSFFSEFGIDIPRALITSPFNGGIINLPAVLMIFLVTFVLTKGTSESKRLNNFLVVVKIAIILLFVIVGFSDVNRGNWKPFLPFGISGVFAGASTVFFAFLGFDALATSAEEVKNVQKNLPRAIIISLVVSTLMYVVVSLVMTGIIKYDRLNVPEAMSFVLLQKGHNVAAQVISAGAILGIIAVVLAFIYASANIMMSMSRGGFLPKKLSILNKKTGSPNKSLWLIGLIAAICAGLLDIKNLATFANVGSLCVFFLISLMVILLRKQHPNLTRPFKVPFGYTIPILSMIVCAFLLFNLPLSAYLNYAGWLIIGLMMYMLYSVRHVDASQSMEIVDDEELEIDVD
ncbi:APC family permease [Companilactobacillus ginsenosidimutans]|uniref:Amino acid permease n=1 Tax=Companilactobacillus ginsenosidimutans TaxID=1007676 RepID=A0A0H4QJ52_9LACO|nr:amino acid permease [Companilactobacillus ginsenosidimutans]AKP67947.1 amino acid permease [Companilactobacillus ginsenosidimutans]